MNEKALFIPLLLLFASSSTTATLDWDDASGDVVIQHEAAIIPSSTGWDDIDLLGGFVSETDSDLQFGLQLAAWDRPPIRTFGRLLYIDFEFEGQPYQITFQSPPCDDEARFRLYNAAADFYEDVECAPIEINEGDATITATVPKSIIKDPRGFPARPGTSIDNIQARSQQAIMSSLVVEDAPTQIRAVDAAPDDATPSYRIVLPIDDDELRFSSALPYRFSNGASTTLAFEVKLENLGQEAHEILLSLTDLPEGITGKVPPRALVGPGEEVTIPVIASTQFAHAHGDQANFQLRGASTRSDAELTLQLGVIFSEVPQPAGHHDRIYLHGFQAPNDLVGANPPTYWANTMKDDSERGATDGDVPPDAVQELVALTQTYEWHFPLQPSLLMGLDFDLARQATWELSIRPGLADPNANVAAKIMYCEPGSTNGIDAGRFGCTTGAWRQLAIHEEPINAAIGQVTTITGKLVISDDEISYMPGGNLMFQIDYMTTDAGLASTLALEPTVNLAGNAIQLPLFEYVEPVDQVFESIGTLSMTVDGIAERLVNPGRTATYHITITNQDEIQKEIELSVEGPNHEWSTWSRENVRLEPGASITLDLAIQPPDDAFDGAAAELFAVASNKDNGLDAALLRLRSTVTTQQDIPSDEFAVQSDEAAPSPILATLLAITLVAAVVRRMH